jgi:hypothetical protein
MREISGFGCKVSLVLLSLALPLPVFASCPIAPNGTLILRAPSGNLSIDTTGSGAVDFDVNDKQVKVQETCGQDKVTVEGSISQTAVIPEWRIRVPKSVNLDVVALAGSVRLTGDSDGSVLIRTGGGIVTTGNIKGETTIITQAGSIKTGNIGNSAELRSVGSLDVGNVAGNAILKTTHGAIHALMVNGDVHAETNGGEINLVDDRGTVVISNTYGGDISIIHANRVEVKTDGGSIHIRDVSGTFTGNTMQGDIVLDKAEAWVEGSTGQGNIVVHMIPTNPNVGDHHVTLRAGVGNILLYVPKEFKAEIIARVENPQIGGQSIVSNFGPAAARALNQIGRTRGALAPDVRNFSPNGGGGSKVQLQASLGTIKISWN